jgi:hypothetical protein
MGTDKSNWNPLFILPRSDLYVSIKVEAYSLNMSSFMWWSDIDSPCCTLAQISEMIKMNGLGRKADDIAILVLTLAINISLS